MSHIQALEDAKSQCRTADSCTQYQALLRQEDQKIDNLTNNDVQTALFVGILMIMVGVFFLLTPFVGLIHKTQRFLLPKLAYLSPVIIGMAIGLVIGFIISFGACYKQLCSTSESTAVLSLPLLSLIVTLPVAVKIYRKRQAMAGGIEKSRAGTWIIIGVLIIISAVIYTGIKVNEIKKSGGSYKQYLRNPGY
ncbi:MAG TPA: hypothetical protein VFX86_00335 [Candidatus Saccharimonadales bacterium]|nr:hypothetical protein [Candidatus Saccharimonadales bacterium]